MLKLTVLASGTGSNFVAIYNAIQNQELDAELKLVLSNNSQSGALAFARSHNINAIHLSSKTVINPEDFEDSMLRCFSDSEIDFIALAGYMKILPAKIVRTYRNRITNIHPALLPHFGGAGMFGIHVHEAVIQSGAKISGATVHLVDEIYDHGAIVMQKTVAVHNDDTPETLAKRVLEIEHEIYPKALQLFAENRVVVENNRMKIIPPIQN